jgi:hypothetical protein
VHGVQLGDEALVLLGLLGQRDSVHALVEFATRNQLPLRLQEQFYLGGLLVHITNFSHLYFTFVL